MNTKTGWKGAVRRPVADHGWLADPLVVPIGAGTALRPCRDANYGGNARTGDHVRRKGEALAQPLDHHLPERGTPRAGEPSSVSRSLLETDQLPAVGAARDRDLQYDPDNRRVELLLTTSGSMELKFLVWRSVS